MLEIFTDGYLYSTDSSIELHICVQCPVKIPVQLHILNKSIQSLINFLFIQTWVTFTGATINVYKNI